MIHEGQPANETMRPITVTLFYHRIQFTVLLSYPELFQPFHHHNFQNWF